MMDVKETVRHQADRTKEHLMKKLDRIFDEAEDEHRCLYDSELFMVKTIWKAIWHACESAKS